MNKLGVQIIGNNFDVNQLAGVYKPAIVKLVDCSVDYYWKVRSIVGSTSIIIVRWYLPSQPLDNPEQRADEWFNSHKVYIMAVKSDYTLFEGYNEIADSSAPQYCAFELRRIMLLESIGANACIGNWSVGVPGIILWTITYAGLVNKCTGRHAIGLHEYWADTADIDNIWHCRRYNMLPSLATKRIVITECGRDYLSDIKRGQPGWQLTCSANTMLSDLFKYRDLINKDANVLGATVFQVGSTDSRWKPFDVSQLWTSVVNSYVKEEVTPMAMPIPIDGRLMSVSEFSAYAPNSDAKNWATRVCIHHTYIPNLADWAARGWEKRKANMAYYYGVTLGWNSGPHLFVSPEGIGLFSPLSKPGVGAKGLDPEGGTWNDHTIHIEVVGDYTINSPSGVVYNNAVAAAAACLQAIGKNIDRLTYHHNLQADTDCPGKGFRNIWAKFVFDVGALINKVNLSNESPTPSKIRWHAEEAYRELKAAGAPENSIGMQRLYELIRLDGGLMYRFENSQKGG